MSRNGEMQGFHQPFEKGGSSYTVVRQVAYTYYVTGESHGNVNDLKLAQIEDGSANVLDTKYYRYYVTEPGGYQDALKYVFNAQSYARLVAALGTNPAWVYSMLG
jgi:hypothetical protein